MGRVPYLGFFRDQDVARWQRRLEAQGLEVWTRPVGAYSTLGYFRDPVLPGMLDWPEHLLAEVILHETAHATLWVPGEVGFNETYAMVVGEEASGRWMLAEHGEGSTEVRRLEEERQDAARWRTLLDGVYQDLDALYKNEDVPPETRLQLKAERLARMDADILRAAFHDSDRLRRMLRDEVWNNARLMQAHAYDDRRAPLESLLARHDGDLRAFTGVLRHGIASHGDPWRAVEAALDTE